MNKRPEITYGEAPDMTVYQRKDGDKLLLYIQKGWEDKSVIYNVLEQRHKNYYIDYLMIYDPNDFARHICKLLDISYVDYDENDFYIMLNNIQPKLYTRALLFYKIDNLELDQLISRLQNNQIPFTLCR